MTKHSTKHCSCAYAILGLGQYAALKDVLKLSETSIFPYRKFLLSDLPWNTSKCCREVVESTVWAAMKKADSIPARLVRLHKSSAALLAMFVDASVPGLS